MSAEPEDTTESSHQPSPDELPPGADRFWGQFSQARSGRSHHADAEEPDRSDGDGHHCLEWCPICRSAELLRSTGGASPELRAQVIALQDEIAHVLRAFAQAYSDRAAASDRGRGEDRGKDPGVTDISIE